MSLQKLLITLVFIVAGVKGTERNNDVVKPKQTLCKDAIVCSQYRNVRIYCSHAIIKRKCPKACGLCPVQNETSVMPQAKTEDTKGQTSQNDEDTCKKPEHASCKSYRDKNYYCKQHWMRENCCRHCKVDKPATSDVTAGAIVSSHVVKKIRARGCHKKDLPMCEQYMQSGRDHYCAHHVIRRHCKRGCGICANEYSVPAESIYAGKCPDPDIPMCAYYIQMGSEHYCRQNFMKAYCKKSCGLCR